MPRSKKKNEIKVKLSNVARVNSIRKSSKQKRNKVTIKRKIGGGDKQETLYLNYEFRKDEKKFRDLKVVGCTKKKKKNKVIEKCAKGSFAKVFFVKLPLTLQNLTNFNQYSFRFFFNKKINKIVIEKPPTYGNKISSKSHSYKVLNKFFNKICEFLIINVNKIEKDISEDLNLENELVLIKKIITGIKNTAIQNKQVYGSLSKKEKKELTFKLITIYFINPGQIIKLFNEINELLKVVRENTQSVSNSTSSMSVIVEILHETVQLLRNPELEIICYNYFEFIAAKKHEHILAHMCNDQNNYLCDIYAYGFITKKTLCNSYEEKMCKKKENRCKWESGECKDKDKHLTNKLIIDQTNDLYKIEGDGVFFSVLEKLNGGELSDYINNILLDQSIVDKKKNLGILIQIARGLEFISTKGFVHTDIKPNNIMLKKKKEEAHKTGVITEVKIIDFGLLQIKNTIQECGTPGYISPEVYNDTPEVYNDTPNNYHNDVFSFGILMGVLLNVRFLFGINFNGLDIENKEEVDQFNLIDEAIYNTNVTPKYHLSKKQAKNYNDNMEIIIRIIYLLCINCRKETETRYTTYRTEDKKPYAPHMVEILYGIHTSTIPKDLKNNFIKEDEDFLIPGLLTLIKKYEPSTNEKKIIGNGIGTLEDFVFKENKEKNAQTKIESDHKNGNRHYLKEVGGEYYFCYGEKNESESEPTIKVKEEQLSIKNGLVRAYNDMLLEKKISLCGLIVD